MAGHQHDAAGEALIVDVAPEHGAEAGQPLRRHPDVGGVCPLEGGWGGRHRLPGGGRCGPEVNEDGQEQRE
jgi:hypothetical protein